MGHFTSFQPEVPSLTPQICLIFWTCEGNAEFQFLINYQYLSSSGLLANIGVLKFDVKSIIIIIIIYYYSVVTYGTALIAVDSYILHRFSQISQIHPLFSLLLHHCLVCLLYISVSIVLYYTPCLKKLCQLIFCSLSVKYEPISIKLGSIVPE